MQGAWSIGAHGHICRVQATAQNGFSTRPIPRLVNENKCCWLNSIVQSLWAVSAAPGMICDLASLSSSEEV